MLKQEKNPEISTLFSDIPAHQLTIIESLLTEKDSKIIELDAKLSKQENKISSLEKEINWFKEQFKLAQQRQFGRSTETSQNLTLEIIFNENDITCFYLMIHSKNFII